MNSFNEGIEIRITHPILNVSFDDIEKQVLSPLYCLWETGLEWVLEFDLPLVEKKDISVSFDEPNTIIVEAKLREVYYDIRIERKNEFRFFQKSVSLPGKLDLQKTTAKFTDGRLIIRVPKLLAKTSVTIE